MPHHGPPERSDAAGTMAYRITLEREGCFNCGACMDLCPVYALDMTRPERPGIEAGARGPGITPWDDGVPGPGRDVHRVRDLRPRVPGSGAGAERRRNLGGRSRGEPVPRPEPPASGWTPLSGLTREVLRDDHVSPWSDLRPWATADRAEAWQVWRTWGERAATPLRAPCREPCPAGTDAGRYVGLLVGGQYGEVRGRGRGGSVRVGLRLHLYSAL